MNARRQEDFDVSRTGRERVYANIPEGIDFLPMSVDLAAGAQGMLNASDLARQTVLNGLGNNDNSSFLVNLEADIASLIASAPRVFSLNGSNAVGPAQANTGTASPTGGNTTVFPTMPARAPSGINGTWIYPPGPVASKPVNAKQRQIAPPGCGLSGFSPAWGDAYAPASVSAQASKINPWLLIAAAGLGLYAISRRGR